MPSGGLLLLARDRLGKKPLVYRHEPGRLLFASELKSLLQVAGRAAADRPAGPGRISDLSVRAAPADDLPRHQQTAARPLGRLSRRPARRSGPTGSPTSASRAICRRASMPAQLRQPAYRGRSRVRLQSEVPLGAFLSGGVDSTIVVGLMRQLAAGRCGRFPSASPCRNMTKRAMPGWRPERFGRFTRSFASSPRRWRSCPGWSGISTSRLPTARPCRPGIFRELTRQHVTVALTGDGGDELFAGYPRYQAVWLAELVRSLAGAGAAAGWPAAIGSGFPSGTRQKSPPAAVEALRRDAWPIGRRGAIWNGSRSSARPAGRGSTARTSLAALPDADPLEFLTAALGRDATAAMPVTAVSLADLVTYLPCDLMTKVDTASMAFGLECRQPFLDHRVVELAARMPSG